MALKQIDYGTEEYRQMVALRDEILRRPLGLSFSAEDLEREKDDILITAFDEDEILGCCILTEVEPSTLRLRQMAVKNNQQGKGIGQAVLTFAETLARAKGYRKMMMHARDSAQGFYERNGYKVVGDQFIEVSVPHHTMEKRLF
jgi:ribosomal protein S18 acetylase RimI-like enzyme